jgi:hypothetical protein
VTVDEAPKTFDSYTLYTTNLGSRAALIDMRGNVLHEWAMPFSRVWPEATHVRRRPDDQIHWFGCHLYPDGTLLAVYHVDGDTPYGYGLVKLNKESRLLWAVADTVHHDVDVDEDGFIYALTQKVVTPSAASSSSIRAPYMADYLVVLSPDGQERKRIPILEAFRDSPFSLLLTALARPKAKGLIERRDMAAQPDNGDLLHTNSVRVVRRSQASQFPCFKPGEVLISLRSLDALAVVDTETGHVVWAATGVWRSQHDAELLDNGHILVYDNLGSAAGTRVLEYDPVTQAIPWFYANDHATPFNATMRGMKQRLPNGNTIIVDPEGGRAFEVTRDKELVWECYFVVSAVAADLPSVSRTFVLTARRYAHAELRFLEEGVRARPQ